MSRSRAGGERGDSCRGCLLRREAPAWEWRAVRSRVGSCAEEKVCWGFRVFLCRDGGCLLACKGGCYSWLLLGTVRFPQLAGEHPEPSGSFLSPFQLTLFTCLITQGAGRWDRAENLFRARNLLENAVLYCPWKPWV